MKLTEQLKLAEKAVAEAEEALEAAETANAENVAAAEARRAGAARDRERALGAMGRKEATEAERLGLHTSAFAEAVLAWAGLRPDEAHEAVVRGVNVLESAVIQWRQRLLRAGTEKERAAYERACIAGNEASSAVRNAENVTWPERRNLQDARGRHDSIQKKVTAAKQRVTKQKPASAVPLTAADQARFVEARRRLMIAGAERRDRPFQKVPPLPPLKWPPK